MKERPIVFSAAMVCAILDGRKTQTRRIMKPQPDCDAIITVGEVGASRGAAYVRYQNEGGICTRISCPYGQPGDQLWVRETWQGPLMDVEVMENEYRASPDDFHNPEYCEYAADGGPAPEFITTDDELVQRWRPSIHMPRWASRIQLEITDIRVERLQDISETDAEAEGCFALGDCECTAKHQYSELWESINGPGSWDANPWVWVVEFKVVSNQKGEFTT